MAAPTVRDSSSTQEPGLEPSFLVVLGPESTETRQLPATGQLAIGRDEDADVRIVDALASRAHARLHIGEGDAIEVEDLGSANGTRVRDQRIPPHQRITVGRGDAIAIGTTILVVQRKEPAFTPRRLWPHAYFETRLIETCAQAEIAHGSFAVVRVHVAAGDQASRCQQLLARILRPGDLLADYGPDEYEMLAGRHRPGQRPVPQRRDDPGAEQRGLDARSRCRALSQRRHLPAGAGQLRLRPGAGGAPATGRQRIRRASEPGHAGALRPGRKGGPGNHQRPHPGRDRRRQGDPGRDRAPPVTAIGRAVRLPQLRGAVGHLLESELFGYEKGAFTGALQPKLGLLEAASTGTLFLDEIGEMSLSLQAKVLRALETKQVLRVGATKPRAVDVRFVAATNRDLEEEVAAKRFREDLYFRLNGVTLAIPPLRERIDELPALAHLFLERVAQQVGVPVPRLTPEALAQLSAYSWPGNLRELRNVLERALLLASAGSITPEHLPQEKLQRRPPP